MYAPFAIVVLLAAGNLVGNPGFEELVAGQPARWDHYVHPQEGAFARVDGEAHDSRYCVMIHAPTPLPENPVNSWSQNLFGDFAGRTFRASAYIRAEEAREAAIWVQCWRKRPLALLDTATTTSTSPVYGTSEWRRVEVLFDAPEGTDFMTVRCVLRGQGTAWFDQVAVRENGEEDPPAPDDAPETAPEGTDAAAETPKPPPPRAASTGAPAPRAARVPARHITADPPAPAPEPRETGPAMQRLRAENRRLREEAGALARDNAGLTLEVMRLREEIRALREAWDTVLAPAEPEPARVPPLVPHGADWRTLR